ncbi:MAG: ester cyclase [Acidobacteriota bacterium]
MAEEKTSFIHRWFEEVWNNRSEKAIDEMVHFEGTARNLGGMQTLTPEDFKKFHRTFVGAFPDLNVTVEDVIVDGDKIAARCRVKGTHLGDDLGLPPTGKPVDFSGMTIVRVVDDKIVDAWNEFDFAGLYGQLGETERNKAIVREWFDQVWNAKDPALIDTVMTEKTVHNGIFGAPDGKLTGPTEFREFWEMMTKAFPEIRFDVKDVFAEGDKVCVRYVARGTQTETLPGVKGITNKKTEFTGGGMCTMKDGKFVEVWNEIDFSKLQYDLDPNTPDIE